MLPARVVLILRLSIDEHSQIVHSFRKLNYVYFVQFFVQKCTSAIFTLFASLLASSSGRVRKKADRAEKQRSRSKMPHKTTITATGPEVS